MTNGDEKTQVQLFLVTWKLVIPKEKNVYDNILRKDFGCFCCDNENNWISQAYCHYWLLTITSLLYTVQLLEVNWCYGSRRPKYALWNKSVLYLHKIKRLSISKDSLYPLCKSSLQRKGKHWKYIYETDAQAQIRWGGGEQGEPLQDLEFLLACRPFSDIQWILIHWS